MKERILDTRSIRNGLSNIYTGDAALPGNSISWTGLRVGATVGDNVSPGSDGDWVGPNDGTSVGWAVIVGEEVLGATETDGDSEGKSVGDAVAKRWQAVSVASIHSGVKASNCWTVWKIAENSQRVPLLLVTKLSADRSPLPNTTTSEAPTALSWKHVFVIATCPNDSTRKLCVSACGFCCCMVRGQRSQSWCESHEIHASAFVIILILSIDPVTSSSTNLPLYCWRPYRSFQRVTLRWRSRSGYCCHRSERSGNLFQNTCCHETHIQRTTRPAGCLVHHHRSNLTWLVLVSCRNPIIERRR